MQVKRFGTICLGAITLFCPVAWQAQHIPLAAAQTTSPPVSGTDQPATSRESELTARIAQLQRENEALKLQLARTQRLLQLEKRLPELPGNLTPKSTIPPNARQFEFNGAPVYIIPIQGSEASLVQPPPLK